MNENVSSELTLSVIVPAFNEESTISIILQKVCLLENLKEIIVVDDCSSDNTPQVVEKLGLSKVKLIRLERNSGKTAAVRRALQEAGGDIIIIQDADLEYDPSEIEDVVKPIIDDRADVVYGSRFLVKRAARVLYFYHYLFNRTITFLSNLLCNVNMTDIETCYKAFRSPLIKNLPLKSSGFGMELEITAMITKTKARIYEVPISYYGRTYEEGKKIDYTDGIAGFWYVLYYNITSCIFPSRRKYIQIANNFLKEMRNQEK